MSSIDKRVVEVQFNNKQFEDGIKETLASLEELKKGLKLEGATQGLKDINTAGGQVDLGGMASSLDHISNRFNAMGAVGFTIIQNLTTAVMEYVGKISRLTLDPLVAGGKRRAQNIEQAKFQFRGLGIDIEKAMDDALYAVLGTAYGLDAAAKAASQLSASQVELGDDMRAALRGISGVAAMTNSSYEDTARIFTRVAGQGRVMAVDLNSIAARGLNAAATLAEAMGTTEAKIREMVSEGKISFADFSTAMNDAFGENATKANETYAGSLSNLRAALSRIGASFFTPYLEKQRDLFNAITPAVDDLGEVLGPVIDMLVGMNKIKTDKMIRFLNNLNLLDLKKIIKPSLGIIRNVMRVIREVIAPIKDAFVQIFPPTSIDQIAEVFNAIERFSRRIKMGGENAENFKRTMAGVFAVFSIGWSVVKEVGRFLWELFGTVAEGSGGFLEATGNVGDFLVALDLAIKNGEGLRQFFVNLRGALERPIQVLRTLGQALGDLFDFEVPDVDAVSGSFSPLVVLGDVLLQVWDTFLDKIGFVWDKLFEMGTKVAGFVGRVATWINEALGGVNLGDVLDILQTGLLATLAYNFEQFVDGMGNKIGTMTYRLTQPFNQLTITLNVMQNTLRSMTLMNIAIAVGVLAASVVALSKVDGPGLTKAMTAISGMMAQLVVSMLAFQKIGGAPGIVRTGAGLILFAVAIRILTSSVKALAELSWEDLVKGLTGTVVLIGALTAATKGMSGNTAGMFRAGAGLLILATGIRVLVKAVEGLSELSWEEMARGLVGVGTLLASLALFTRLASADKGGVLQGAGLLLLAAGIKVLASAAGDFAAMSWEEIGKGLASVAAILAAFAAFSHAVSPKKLISTSVALVIVGGAMKILASALADFGDMPWDAIGRGLTAMAGSLVAVVVALNLMPPNTLASAAALVAVSYALGMMADAVEQMGGMGWDEIGRGLATLAGSLLIIAAATLAMTTALPGAAAILVVASALKILAPILMTFSQMSIREIATALGVLAGVFLVIGIAGALLTPVVPTLLALGAAIALIGIGAALAGLGLAAAAAGLTALAAAGAAGTAALVGLIAALVGMIPMMARALGMAVVAFAEVIGEAGPAILDALVAIFGSIIGAIAENGPLLIDTLGDLVLKMIEKLEEVVPPMVDAAINMMIGILEAINSNIDSVVSEVSALLIAMLTAMANHISDMVAAGIALIVAFLEGIAENVGDIITAGADIIIALIEGIGENQLRIIEAAMETVLTFITGLTAAIEEYAPKIREAGEELAFAIVDGMTGGLASKVGDIVSSAGSLAQSAIDSAKGVLETGSPSKVFKQIGEWVGEGFQEGLVGSREDIVRTWEGTMDLIARANESAARNIEQLQNKLERLQKAKKKDQKAIKETKKELEQANYEYNKTFHLHKQMEGMYKDERIALQNLGKQYDQNTRKLEAANSKLKDAIRTRDDYKRQIESEYSDLPDIMEEGLTVDQYMDDLLEAGTKIGEFGGVMQRLRDKGLGDNIYKELLDRGPEALDFARSLLEGGDEAIERINMLSDRLEQRGKWMGARVSKELYQAGVDAAKGLVDGLESERAALRKQMEKIANYMVDELKRKLEIKSPSRRMHTLGGQSIEGLAKGMSDTGKLVSKAAQGVGDDALDTMRKSISGMSDILSMETDMNPKITPVIDMSEIRKGAAEIGSTIGKDRIMIDAAYRKAKDASTRYESTKVDRESAVEARDRELVRMSYTQNNYSPKALSSAEIYRRTKNQLSTTKGALTTDAVEES